MGKPAKGLCWRCKEGIMEFHAEGDPGALVSYVEFRCNKCGQQNRDYGVQIVEGPINVSDAVSRTKIRGTTGGDDSPPEPPQAPKIGLGMLRDLYMNNADMISSVMDRGVKEVLSEVAKLVMKFAIGARLYVGRSGA